MGARTGARRDRLGVDLKGYSYHPPCSTFMLHVRGRTRSVGVCRRSFVVAVGGRGPQKKNSVIELHGTLDIQYSDIVLGYSEARLTNETDGP